MSASDFTNPVLAKKKSAYQVSSFKIPSSGLHICLYHALLITAAYLGSFLLRFDFIPDHQDLVLFEHTLLFVLILKLAVFQWFGLGVGWWRYVGFHDLLGIG